MLLIVLLTDALMVAFASLLLIAALRRETHGLIAGLAGWLLGCFTIIASAGVVLGALGQFSAGGFWCFHFATLVIATSLRRKTVKDDFQLPLTWFRRAWQLIREDRYLRWAVFALGLFCLFTAFFAAAGQPIIYDTITYRLPRIAHWLQEGAIGVITTNDPRQNYMPVVPDIVMAWILGGTATGYAGVALAQWAGGILLLIVTMGLARQYGLSRLASVAAACLVAGAANVAPQFTTSQTDLITAGFVSASFFFWRLNAGLKQGSIFFGLAAGLALGSKGTVFYFLPGLGIMAVWYAWRSRLPLKTWGLSLLAAFLSIGLFFIPGTIRNWVHYGGIFGPEEFVAIHHHTEDGRLLEKTKLNLASFFIQSLEPHSQMPGIGSATRALGNQLINLLPKEDPFTFGTSTRRNQLYRSLNLSRPDANGTTYGVVLLFLLILGGVSSILAKKRQGSEEIRVICMALFISLVFFHAMQQWHPYGHRYFILTAPWIAIVGTWFIEGIRHLVRGFVWSLVLFSSVCTAVGTLYACQNAGRTAALYPEDELFSRVHIMWTRWLNELPSELDTIYVALPFNRPLTPFYRRENSQHINIVQLASLSTLSAEQAVSRLEAACLITQSQHFAGNEGNVLSRHFVFQDEPSGAFNLTAYKKVVSDNSEEPVKSPLNDSPAAGLR